MRIAWPPLSPRFLSLAACGAALVAICGSPAAQAQVNKCLIDGQLVFRSAPCPLEPRAASVRVAVAATAAPVPSKKKTLADALRERDRASPSLPAIQEFQGDGANVLRSRMGAS